MKFTGERYIPGETGEVEIEHYHRYVIASRLVKGKSVLDIACGEGYGSNILAKMADMVVGVDISEEAIGHASRRYGKPDKLDFRQGDCADIPVDDSSIDIVISFETIEHHDKHSEMVSEIKRVLKKDGLLFISSPNKEEYSDKPNYSNPFHVKELYTEELKKLLTSFFSNVEFFSQQIIYGSSILPVKNKRSLEFYSKSDGGEIDQSSVLASKYDVVLASDGKLPPLQGSIFTEDIDSLFDGHNRHISQLTEVLESVVVDRDAQLKGVELLTTELASVTKVHEQHIEELTESLESVIADRDAHSESAERLTTELASVTKVHEQHIEELTESLESVIADRDAHSESAERLTTELASVTKVHEQHIEELTESLESVIADRDAHSESAERLTTELASVTKVHEQHIEELTESLESVIADRDAHSESAERLTIELASVTQVHEQHIQELTHSLEAVIVDRDSQVIAVDQLTSALSFAEKENTRLLSALDCEKIRTSTLIESLATADQSITSILNSKWFRIYDRFRTFVFKQQVFSELEESHSKVINTLKSNPTPQMLLQSEQVEPSILLVSHYAPSRAHAGGLRILDLYSLIRSKCPSTKLDLFTYHRPDIDGSIEDSYQIFDNVYLSPVEKLSAETFSGLLGVKKKSYSVIDLQFHQTGFEIEGYRNLGGRILFTPMESMAKSLYLDINKKSDRNDKLKIRSLAAKFKEAYEEIKFCRAVDKVVCVSKSDAAFLRLIIGGGRAQGIETGLSPLEFSAVLADKNKSYFGCVEENTIIYVAYFGSQTNIEALSWYLDKVHPQIVDKVPDYKLSVVGRGDLSQFQRYIGKNVDLVGEVAELGPYISKSSVGIAPALSGSGFRGKVNQYTIYGVPTVASSIAKKGLAYSNGKSIFVADDPVEFAKACVSLLTDAELNKSMATNARDLCLEKYTWDSKWPLVAKTYFLEKAYS